MKTIYVDIDNTICRTEGTDYANAKPIPERIAVVNRLYDAGNEIVIWTARGALRGVTLAMATMTKRQLATWGVKFHQLRMDKPYFDTLVDDRAVSSLMEVQ